MISASPNREAWSFTRKRDSCTSIAVEIESWLSKQAVPLSAIRERSQGLNPGGGSFGPDGWYYVGLRGRRTVTVLLLTLEAPGEDFLAPGIVPFPRGFAFGRDGRLFLGSGIGPQGEGDNAIVSFAATHKMRPSTLVSDPELSPLDLAIVANANVVVSSEYPFGVSDVVTTVREYDPMDGRLVRAFRSHRVGRISPTARPSFRSR